MLWRSMMAMPKQCHQQRPLKVRFAVGSFFRLGSGLGLNSGRLGVDPVSAWGRSGGSWGVCLWSVCKTPSHHLGLGRCWRSGRWGLAIWRRYARYRLATWGEVPAGCAKGAPRDVRAGFSQTGEGRAAWPSGAWQPPRPRSAPGAAIRVCQRPHAPPPRRGQRPRRHRVPPPRRSHLQRPEAYLAQLHEAACDLVGI